MALTNGWWTWAGNIVGASDTNDLGLAKRDLIEMKNQMEMRDLMIVDRGFRAIRDKIALLVGWTKPRTEELPLWQYQENNEVSLQRGKIEFYTIYYY